MEINTINAALFAKMFLAGAKNLESKKEWINELNVFPVPDGDTGTNMTMTIMAAAKEVAALEDPTMEVLAKAISSGSLRGARGNSGVILSQLEISIFFCTDHHCCFPSRPYTAVMVNGRSLSSVFLRPYRICSINNQRIILHDLLFLRFACNI